MPGRTLLITTLILALSILPSTCFALQKGDKFPDVSGQTLDSEQFSITQLQGRPLLIKIGTTWCPACKEQNSEIAKIREFLKTNQIRFIDIYVQEPAQLVRKSLQQAKEDPADIIILDDGSIARRLNVFAIPRVILVDKNFRVFSDTNPVSADFIKTSFKQMLTEN